MNRFNSIPMRWKLVATMVVTTLVVVVLVSAMMMRYTRESTELAGLTTARALANQVVALRTFYTTKVVGPARSAGIDVNYDFENKQHTLPLPATMVKALGEDIADAYPGNHIRLYSKYPFPHRSESEEYDQFELEALERLETDPLTPVHRLEEYNGRQTMRYAVADLMRTSCVNCHNTHPESPKTDWKKGDVRGVVEVMIPIDQAARAAQSSVLKLSAIVMGGFAAIVIATLFTIRSTSSHLNAQVGAMSGDLTQISKAINNHARFALEQAEAARRATSTTEQLESLAHSSSADAGSISSHMQELLKIARNGNEVVQQTITTMTAVEMKVGATTQHMHQLSAEVDQIAEVNRLVGDFAKAANLLALNAAVEAARAGASGEGFAVVAVEIRKLADECEVAVASIKVLIKHIHDAKDAALQVSLDGAAVVVGGMQAAHRAGEAFDSLTDSIAETAGLVGNISSAARQQAIASQHVLQQISSVNSGAVETANGIEETKLTIQHVNTVADAVKTMI